MYLVSYCKNSLQSEKIITYNFLNNQKQKNERQGKIILQRGGNGGEGIIFFFRISNQSI